MKDSPDYVFGMVEALKDCGIERFMLPDTLGVLYTDEAFSFCKLMVDKYPELHFDYHGHNDYDLSVANTAAAVKAGMKGIHVTVNGLGERTGNTPVASIVGEDTLRFIRGGLLDMGIAEIHHVGTPVTMPVFGKQRRV